MPDSMGTMTIGYVAKQQAEQVANIFGSAAEAIRQHLQGAVLYISEANPIEVLTILQSMAIIELQDKMERA